MSEPPLASNTPSQRDRPPSVDRLARSLASSGLPHPVLVEVARSAIAANRADHAADMAEQRARRLLTPVINATGVLLHTNLGRAPFGHESTASYTNLELSLASGKRGSRWNLVGELAATACGADAAIVVNNCAGAVLLSLAALAAGEGVAVSRGDLVEIGGGFRIPDVMRQSGAQLVEVGTTNRTRLSDFQQVQDDIALVMDVHRSNYRIEGFTESVSVDQLATVDVPLIADIGSGLLDATCPWLEGPPPPWLRDEPAARQTLEAGADLVLFSGDKLLGGPQAGIIAGRADLVERCRTHPLARALRPGSLVTGALQALLLTYLERRGNDIPFWRMATTPVEQLEERARGLASETGWEWVQTEATPGGGTLPGVTIPSCGVATDANVIAPLRARMRPIIGRVEEGRTIIDLRTVDPADDETLAEALAESSR